MLKKINLLMNLLWSDKLYLKENFMENNNSNVNNNCYVFWKRILAFWTDSILLLIVAYVLLTLFKNQLFSIGNWGILIGFAIFMLYYGLQNSRLCGGQTLGKRLFKIKVVDFNNQFLSVQKSLLRALILTPMFVFGSLLLPVGNVVIIYSIIIGFISFVIVMLFLFNFPQRRSLHDLVAGSIVVNSNCEAVEFVKTRKPLIIISIGAVLTVLLAALCFVYIPKVGMNLDEINGVARLYRQNDLNLAGYSIQYIYDYNYNTHESVTKKGISLTIAENSKDFQNEKFASARINDYAKIFLNSEFKKDDIEFMTIGIANYATFGTNSKIKMFSKKASMQDWLNGVDIPILSSEKIK